MAKELPYFKFHCTEWMTGNIIFEPLEVQGLFINICALYWKRLGVLELSEIEQRYRKKSLIAKLSGRFFSVSGGFIKISFLDDQLTERQGISKTNSGNGKLGGRPRKEKNKANGKRTESETKANESNIEREGEKEKEKDNLFDHFWNLYGKKTGKDKCKKAFDRLPYELKSLIILKVPAYVKSTPEVKFRKDPLTWLNGKHWEDEIIEQSQQRRIIV